MPDHNGKFKTREYWNELKLLNLSKCTTGFLQKESHNQYGNETSSYLVVNTILLSHFT